jgi:hypothetical protein
MKSVPLLIAELQGSMRLSRTQQFYVLFTSILHWNIHGISFETAHRLTLTTSSFYSSCPAHRLPNFCWASVTRDGVTRDGVTRDGVTRDGVTRDGVTRDGVT